MFFKLIVHYVISNKNVELFMSENLASRVCSTSEPTIRLILLTYEIRRFILQVAFTANTKHKI